MKRFSSRTRGVVLGLVLAAIPFSVVFAADIFTDVPDTNSAHDAISNVANAGVTLGDPSNSTTYTPTKSVTRAAMASFLNRGLGRVAFSGNGPDVPAPVGLTATTLGSLVLTSGGLESDNSPILNANQANFFKADASFSVVCADVTDPCQVLVTIDDGTDSSRIVSVNLDVGEVGHGSITWANDAPVETDTTLTLSAISTGVGEAEATGEVSAIYAPFGADGANTLDPAP